MYKIVGCSYKPSLQQKKLIALQTDIISTHYITCLTLQCLKSIKVEVSIELHYTYVKCTCHTMGI